jgi:RND family efflux transporter MFP subunit
MRWKWILGWLGCAALAVGASEDAARVTVVEATRGEVVEVVTLTGTVTAERRASLSARTAGLVSSVAVEEGSRVEEGEVILELDSTLAEMALEGATEAVRESVAQSEETERLSQEGTALAKSGGLPTTEAAARAAALRVQRAAVRQLDVDRREQAEIVARHRLVAPFAGVISEKMAEVGEWVETGVPVLELVEVDAVRFDVRAPQEFFAAMREGDGATVRLDSGTGADFPAKIVARVPVKDAVTRTFLVRLDVDAGADVMAPGVSGTADFRLASGRESVTIPRDAIVRQPDGSVGVWVVADGVAEARSVEIGSRMGETVEVRSGIESGERVVVRGNESLQPGQALEVIGGGEGE